MGKFGVAQGGEFLQALEGPDTRLFQTEDLPEILVEDFDAPAAEGVVGDGHGGGPPFFGGRERAEADAIGVEGTPVKGVGNGQNRIVAC